jgi:hypothetical protein
VDGKHPVMHGDRSELRARSTTFPEGRLNFLTATNQHETERRYDALYEQYGKPLEHDHTGQYLAIAPDGRIVLGSTLLEVAQIASDRLGSGHFLFKVGERSVGKWR